MYKYLSFSRRFDMGWSLGLLSFTGVSIKHWEAGVTERDSRVS